MPRERTDFTGNDAILDRNASISLRLDLLGSPVLVFVMGPETESLAMLEATPCGCAGSQR